MTPPFSRPPPFGVGGGVGDFIKAKLKKVRVVVAVAQTILRGGKVARWVPKLAHRSWN